MIRILLSTKLGERRWTQVKRSWTAMISYDKLWKTLIDKHMNKMELRDWIGISNAILAKLSLR